jgi:hypothetical protein
MRFEHAFLVALLTIGTVVPAAGFAPNGCEQQRKQYPDKWNDTASEKPLFTCHSHYNGIFRIKIGVGDGAGRTMMSLVPVSPPGTIEKTHGVLRIWLDKEQTQRLRDGKYFATVVRKEKSCWIRGDLNGDTVFFMDNADPPANGRKRARPSLRVAPSSLDWLHNFQISPDGSRTSLGSIGTLRRKN